MPTEASESSLNRRRSSLKSTAGSRGMPDDIAVLLAAGPRRARVGEGIIPAARGGVDRRMARRQRQADRLLDLQPPRRHRAERLARLARAAVEEHEPYDMSREAHVRICGGRTPGYPAQRLLFVQGSNILGSTANPKRRDAGLDGP